MLLPLSHAAMGSAVPGSQAEMRKAGERAATRELSMDAAAWPTRRELGAATPQSSSATTKTSLASQMRVDWAYLGAHLAASLAAVRPRAAR